MVAFRLTEAAENDLVGIRTYSLKQFGKKQTIKYLTQLEQALVLLSESPALGQKRLDIDSDIFSFPYQSHMIYFTKDVDVIVVFAVLHQKMIPHKHLEDREVD